jgi:tight adherence protein B
MDHISEIVERLGPFKWGGMAVFFVGLFFLVWLVMRDLEGLPYRYWTRYVVYLERQMARLFIWKPGGPIVIGQLVAVFLVLTLTLLVNLPYWYVFVVLIALAPAAYIERMRRERVAQIESQLDGFILAMANALKATPSIGDAFISVQPLTRPPLQQEIGLALKEMRVGSSLDQALLLMASRIGSRQVDSALSALLIGRQVGGNLPKILDATSASLREMGRLEQMVKAKTAEGKAQLGVLSVFPIFLVFAFSSLKEGYFDPLTQSVTGYGLIMASAVFWVLSLILARKIVSVDI